MTHNDSLIRGTLPHRGKPLDSDAKPPESLRRVYKRFHKLAPSAVLDQADFIRTPGHDNVAYEVAGIPGLVIYASLLPPPTQLFLLDALLHRHLSNPAHLTNVHAHYHTPYPASCTSYFHSSASSLTFQPRDPSLHSAFTTEQFLTKKLRWMTLGGQYDWTRKVYPDDTPPAFPADVGNLIHDLFPSMTPEAAIVNMYAPGDTLSLHRDVAEQCEKPLVSVSLGCEGIFVVGLDAEGGDKDEEPRVATVTLKSGDAVLMSGESRWAWHGLAKVLEGTCPRWMEQWPFVQNDLEMREDGGPERSGCEEYEAWKGWMKAKRINLNVRQMFD